MNKPFFSVVIPTYNREKFISHAIESALSQQFLDFELIIIDDGSVDGTDKAVASFSDERIRYKKITNVERGAARNVGIQSSNGQYVTFLDSDDYFHQDHLLYCYEKLIQNGYPVFYHQGYVVMDSSGKVVQKSFKGSKINEALFEKGNVMSCLGVFVQRKILLGNSFNENRILAGLEDWELWIRLASQFEIVNDTRVTAVLRQHNERSVEQVEKHTLETKCLLFIELISTNPLVVKKYAHLIPYFVANVYTYASLLLSQNHEKSSALHYLGKGIRQDVRQIFKKRILIIFRNLLLR